MAVPNARRNETLGCPFSNDINSTYFPPPWRFAPNLNPQVTVPHPVRFLSRNLLFNFPITHSWSHRTSWKLISFESACCSTPQHIRFTRTILYAEPTNNVPPKKSTSDFIGWKVVYVPPTDTAFLTCQVSAFPVPVFK